MVALRKPTRRVCERCGREERWLEESEQWVVVDVDGEPRVGSVYCLHDWDINGDFVPYQD